jgi:hypothetical protein
LIRRGPKHPDVVAFENKHAFYLGRPGHPDTVFHEDDILTVKVLELFSTKESAEENAALWAEDGVEQSMAIKATGVEILNFFGLADVVEIDSQSFSLTGHEASFLESDRDSLCDIIAALPSR